MNNFTKESFLSDNWVYAPRTPEEWEAFEKYKEEIQEKIKKYEKEHPGQSLAINYG